MVGRKKNRHLALTAPGNNNNNVPLVLVRGPAAQPKKKGFGAPNSIWAWKLWDVLYNHVTQSWAWAPQDSQK